jgi:Asp-tRNA(Asn)/Glu-tRNA(Gln) amidotransferase A subunit family amidase
MFTSIQQRYTFAFLCILYLSTPIMSQKQHPIRTQTIQQAEALIGLNFTPAERDSLLDEAKEHLKSFETLRAQALPNAIPPALHFHPIPVGFQFSPHQNPISFGPPAHTDVPANEAELAFYSVRDLGELIRTKKMTATQLTQLYLKRLKTYGPELECVITLTEELALAQAKRADEEIAAGKYRGPLHGIPYGAKDLLATKGYKTTWGATPYKEQIIDQDATVIQKLETAGAILVAKLTLGALAWGDVWYGGTTRNPHDLKQGSSGSSAGSASATSAGLVAFAIGSETWGSIVSPATRCGVTGLRPTFGRVSRTGAMTLSWSMDKLGPICRTVEDAAIVFDALRGGDGIDQTVVDAPFNYTPQIDIKSLRIGYVQSLFEDKEKTTQTDLATLDAIKNLGVKPIPITLPDAPIEALSFILSAEAAAAFDDLTRTNRDDLLTRQIKNAWPNVFRAARFIPAVEYIQANRLRYQLIQDMQQIMQDIDVYIVPSFGGNNLLLTNLTGHPCVTLPNGFDETGHPLSISFIGRLFDEATLLAVAHQYQVATTFHLQHPVRYRK